VDKILIQRDVPITMDDELNIRADIFGPKDEGKYPVIMIQGVYGKGVPYRDASEPQWKVLMDEKPEVQPNSSKEHMVWETVDPETWFSV
jgi:predicted acyl esterase